MESNQILDRLFADYGRNSVEMVIRYGNPNGQDIDLLAVVDDSFPAVDYQPTIVGLDIYFCPLNRFVIEREHACPAITEPILTGELIYGDLDIFGQIRSELLLKKISSENCRKIRNLAGEYLTNAIRWLEYPQIDPASRLINVLNCLSFAVSYEHFARQYEIHPQGVITLAELRKKGIGLLEKVFQSMKNAKVRNFLTPAEIKLLTEEARRTLQGNE